MQKKVLLAVAGGGDSGAGGGQLQRNPAEVDSPWHQVGRQVGGASHPVV